MIGPRTANQQDVCQYPHIKIMESAFLTLGFNHTHMATVTVLSQKGHLSYLLFLQLQGMDRMEAIVLNCQACRSLISTRAICCTVSL